VGSADTFDGYRWSSFRWSSLGAEFDSEHVGGVHTVFVSVHPMVDDGRFAAGPYFVVAAFIWRVRSKRRGVDGVRLDLREVDDGDSCGGDGIGRRRIEPDRREVDAERLEPSGRPVAGDLDSCSTIRDRGAVRCHHERCTSPRRERGTYVTLAAAGDDDGGLDGCSASNACAEGVGS
jgi:hypothetical protein